MHHNGRRAHYADGSGRTATGLGRAADHGPRDGRGKNNGDYIVTGKGENFYLCAAQQVQRKKKERVGLFLSRVRPDDPLAPMINNCIGEKDICDMWQAHYKDLLNNVESFKSKEFVERKFTSIADS